jgi:hypothetical protein
LGAGSVIAGSTAPMAGGWPSAMAQGTKAAHTPAIVSILRKSHLIILSSSGGVKLPMEAPDGGNKNERRSFNKKNF